MLLSFAAALLSLSSRAEEPIVFTVRFPSPAAHTAEVTASYPTGGREAVELLMPRWSPGFYRVEPYASKVGELSAAGGDGAPLGVQRPKDNRWRIETGGASRVEVRYTLLCDSQSVTTNWVGERYAVLNGAATFLTLAGDEKRPHEVRLELAPGWTRAMTALPDAAGGPGRFLAADFDQLVDSPIVAGALEVREFEAAGARHEVVDVGECAGWDGGRAAVDLRRIAEENARFWGSLPFKRYLFLSVFRRGGGGLEHRDSTLLTSSVEAQKSPAGYLTWLNFVSHEYFHAFNAKRLRPVELGPFDYENEPRTAGLWIAEGITAYYDGLLPVRAGLGKPADFLAGLSDDIGRLQRSPGRLHQSLERASLDVWTTSFSGIGGGEKTVSYYVKGAVAAFLLDARVRAATAGARSLDDVMRLAYRRFGGEKGFTPDQFRETAEEVAGVKLAEWLRRAVCTTEELEYDEALEWFGLRFAQEKEGARSWRLEARPDASAEQRARLDAWLGPSTGPRPDR